MKEEKIVKLEDLVRICEEKRKDEKKIVHCHGCFDLLHPGHIKHLNAARKYGDFLVVTVTPDVFVNKGPDRPIFDELLRMESLASLDSVDYVALNKWDNASETIKILKPNFFAKGAEYKFIENDGFNEELDVLNSVQGEIIYTDEITFSSSNILNKHLYSKEVLNYLKKFKQKFEYSDMLDYINRIKDLKVLVIGEILIDEYIYGEYLGKMRRESIMEFMSTSTKRFLGGSGMVANHLTNFVGQTSIVSLIGELNSNIGFIEETLDKKINRHFFIKPNSPTPIKRRYIDERGFLKIFKSAELNDTEITGEISDKIIRWLEKNLSNFDLVITMDYGHGMINNRMKKILIKKSKFLAVNTQINIENRGYNTIDKYSKLDYACINEEELRLVAKDKYGNLTKLVNQLLKKNEIKKLSITRGNHGCISYSAKDDFHFIPAFTLRTSEVTDTLDTMGAGDAFFAITAPLASLDIPIESIGFIGNAVGDMHTKVIGNEKAIERNDMIKYIESLMK